ncbi:TetR/AcrR family transcriptional regulator [Rhizohabitans arisaemae]|uniref:TetR/AcrR family transcriptional regulator n=1 Tax=Rhizohabitans arisaemae TaxID=2720610 RepID=UPI0024B14971|nr:TetR/AcrR family transcriptional regulator C-terminal ligand-binding domain-containing protein [Rhizohabitans arisaemae]
MTIADPTAGTTRPPGRPRSEKAEKAIIQATLDLIGEGVGIREITIEAVAARAGVGKTTIYRRWPGREELIVDALTTLKAPIPPLAGESVRADLITCLDAMREEASDSGKRCMMNLAMADWARSPRLYERYYKVAIKPRREAMRRILRRGLETGEIRADTDVELAMAALSGTMLMYTKWADPGETLPLDLAERVVDLVMRGLSPGNAG